VVVRPTSVLACCAVSVFLGGCPDTNTSGRAGSPIPADASSLGDGAVENDASSGAYPLPFFIPDAEVSPQDAAAVSDAVLDGPGCDLFTEAGTWTCLAPGSYVHRFKEYADGSKLSVFVVKSLRVQAGVIVETHERWPAIVVSLGDATLLGSIHVVPGTLGGGVTSQPTSPGSSSGGGVQGGSTVAGEGASFCGLGRKGGAMPGASAGPPRQKYGSVELSPLLGGSSGGSGDATGTGSGGGAIHLVAGGTFTLAKDAFITAPGSGGAGGTRASGGGSGGAILIEATTVLVEGTLAANGGGGGQGGGDPGEDGKPAATVGSGGARSVAGTVAARGGDGGAGDTPDGTDGAANGTNPPGGGGGGAGRIRLNAKAGAVTVTGGTLSPSLATGCATTGAIAP
jgi:hypothetical protein